MYIYTCVLCSVVVTLCNPMDCSMPASLSFTVSWSLLKFMSIELVMLSNNLILYHPFLLPSIFPNKRVFSTESGLPISQFGHSVVSSSLRPHELQHARPPCPSPTPAVHPNPCSLSQWCHPTISSSVIPFFSCPQSFPASGSFPVSQFFTSGGKVLEFQLQHQSCQWTPRTDLG